MSKSNPYPHIAEHTPDMDLLKVKLPDQENIQKLGKKRKPQKYQEYHREQGAELFHLESLSKLIEPRKNTDLAVLPRLQRFRKEKLNQEQVNGSQKGSKPEGRGIAKPGRHQ